MQNRQNGHACPPVQKLLTFSDRTLPGCMSEIGQPCHHQQNPGNWTHRSAAKRHATLLCMSVWGRTGQGLVIIFVFILAVQIPGPAGASRVIQLQLDSVEGEGWSIKNLQLELALLSANAAGLQLTIAHLTLPAPLGRLTDLAVACSHVIFSSTELGCSRGTLQLGLPLFDQQPTPFSFTYEHDLSRLRFSLSQLPLAAGRIEVEGRLEQGQWQLTLTATQLEIGQLTGQLIQTFKDQFVWLANFTNFESSGTVNVRLRISGHDGQLGRAHCSGDLFDLTFSDAQGVYAGEQLRAHFSIQATQTQASPVGVQAGLIVRTHFALQQGQVYIDPVFFEVSQQPVTLVSEITWQSNPPNLNISQFAFTHPRVLKLTGHIHPDLQALSVWQPPQDFFALLENPDQLPLHNATLHFNKTALDSVYQTYLQPFLIGTKLDTLDTAGQLSVTLAYQRDDHASTQIVLEQVSLHDQQNRCGLEGLSGTLLWTSPHGPALTSRLTWQGGQIYQIPFGKSTLTVSVQGRRLDLLTPTSVPVLDGAVQVGHFHLEPPGSSDMEWQFEGSFRQLSLRAFSQAVDWPALSGTLSGATPRVTYRDGIVQVDGDISIRVFDGTITIRDLRLEQPLSLVPLLYANIEVSELDLEKLTETFAFGRVQGRLSGQVRQLSLQDWQPVSFEASFATPKDDDASHRISQKAVDNLASLGGISGVLSRSMLRFFDDFSYTRLGLSCRLERSVCEMDGIESVDDGYYIVKGGGLPPRIDVIGRVRRVAWAELLARLQLALISGTPEIR